MGKKNILCITSTFPYGRKETYFQTELEYLSRAFDTVVILPIYNPYAYESRRDVPENVVVMSPILEKSKIKRIFKWLITCNIFNKVFKEFFKFSVYTNSFKFQRWFNSVVLYSIGVERILGIMQASKNTKETFLYSYWAECPFFIHEKLNKFRKIVRMHGADFYVERNKGYLPVRQQIYDSANCLLPISNNIKDRLEIVYRQPKEKMHLSYLGTTNESLYCITNLTNNKVIRIVSCSNVVKLKRVDLIYKILIQIDPKIYVEWHHIGDGPELKSVIEFVKNERRDNIITKFHGQKSQSEIKEIYQNEYFHWFINVSEYEGLPVSIMEAFSFGIPTIATDVGGTREIVNSNNGQLLAADLLEKENIALIITDCEGKDYTRKRVNSFLTWYDQFNADENYRVMLNQILENN